MYGFVWKRAVNILTAFETSSRSSNVCPFASIAIIQLSIIYYFNRPVSDDVPTEEKEKTEEELDKE